MINNSYSFELNTTHEEVYDIFKKIKHYEGNKVDNFDKYITLLLDENNISKSDDILYVIYYNYLTSDIKIDVGKTSILLEFLNNNTIELHIKSKVKFSILFNQRFYENNKNVFFALIDIMDSHIDYNEYVIAMELFRIIYKIKDVYNYPSAINERLYPMHTSYEIYLYENKMRYYFDNVYIDCLIDEKYDNNNIVKNIYKYYNRDIKKQIDPRIIFLSDNNTIYFNSKFMKFKESPEMHVVYEFEKDFIDNEIHNIIIKIQERTINWKLYALSEFERRLYGINLDKCDIERVYEIICNYEYFTKKSITDFRMNYRYYETDN